MLGCHPPIQGAVVSPMAGIVPAGGRTQLSFELTATELGSFESWLKIQLKEGKTMTVRVTGSIELPKVYINLVSLYMYMCTCTCTHVHVHVYCTNMAQIWQWNLSKMGTIGTGRSVLIKEVSSCQRYSVVLYTTANFGTPGSVLIIEVSLYQSVLIRVIPL